MFVVLGRPSEDTLASFGLDAAIIPLALLAPTLFEKQCVTDLWAFLQIAAIGINGALLQFSRMFAR